MYQDYLFKTPVNAAPLAVFLKTRNMKLLLNTSNDFLARSSMCCYSNQHPRIQNTVAS